MFIKFSRIKNIFDFKLNHAQSTKGTHKVISAIAICTACCKPTTLVWKIYAINFPGDVIQANNLSFLIISIKNLDLVRPSSTCNYQTRVILAETARVKRTVIIRFLSLLWPGDSLLEFTCSEIPYLELICISVTGG